MRKLRRDNFKEEDEDEGWDEDNVPTDSQDRKFAFQLSDDWSVSSPTTLPFKETSVPPLEGSSEELTQIREQLRLVQAAQEE